MLANFCFQKYVFKIVFVTVEPFQKTIDRNDATEFANPIEYASSNPITPPFSDESNFSTTPSPNDVWMNVRPPPVLINEPIMENGTAMLSPHYGINDGTDWRPQGEHLNMVSTPRDC